MTTKEHPILFSGPLVRAILDGKKTQTRRIIRPPHGIGWVAGGPIIRTAADLADPWFRWEREQSFAELEFRDVRCPYGQPGDRLWVRETWAALGNEDGLPVNDKDEIVEWGPGVACIYRADTKPGEYGADVLPDECQWFGKWRPSIHMPRWASRISLEVTEVRVQHIQDITEEDARAEGIHEHPLGRAALDANGTHKGAFLAVWEAINGTRPGGSIGENPWVWAVSFRMVQP